MSYEINISDFKQVVNQLATLSYKDGCIDVTVMYQKLDISEDEFYILFGESDHEDYDIKILKSRIVNIIRKNDSIVASLENGNELIITYENGLDDDELTI